MYKAPPPPPAAAPINAPFLPPAMPPTAAPPAAPPATVSLSRCFCQNVRLCRRWRRVWAADETAEFADAFAANTGSEMPNMTDNNIDTMIFLILSSIDFDGSQAAYIIAPGPTKHCLLPNIAKRPTFR